eukprot:Colp12_sorted_trinity150504_noHs@3064
MATYYSAALASTMRAGQVILPDPTLEALPHGAPIEHLSDRVKELLAMKGGLTHLQIVTVIQLGQALATAQQRFLGRPAEWRAFLQQHNLPSERRARKIMALHRLADKAPRIKLIQHGFLEDLLDNIQNFNDLFDRHPFELAKWSLTTPQELTYYNFMDQPIQRVRYHGAQAISMRTQSSFVMQPLGDAIHPNTTINDSGVAPSAPPSVRSDACSARSVHTHASASSRGTSVSRASRSNTTARFSQLRITSLFEKRNQNHKNSE